MNTEINKERVARYGVGDIVDHKLGEKLVVTRVEMYPDYTYHTDIVQKRNFFGRKVNIQVKISNPTTYYFSGHYYVRRKNVSEEIMILEEELF